MKKERKEWKTKTLCTWRRICVPVHRKADTSEPIISKASSRIKIICVKILATAHPKMDHTYLKKATRFFIFRFYKLTRRMLKDIGCKTYSEIKLDCTTYWSPCNGYTNCQGVPIGVTTNLNKNRMKLFLKFVLQLGCIARTLSLYIYIKWSAYIWHLKIISIYACVSHGEVPKMWWIAFKLSIYSLLYFSFSSSYTRT